MDNYICKVANREELLKRWEYLIDIHPGNNKWVEFKENALKHYDENSTITYLGFLNAVIISPDEATYELINNEQGEFYNVFSERLNKYLTRKVGEIAIAGANVIFERGLWSRKERKEIREYYKNNGIECEIHYVCVDDETWKQNIEERNKRIEDGNGGADFYLDEGLMKKLESKWEEPSEDEYDILY